MDALPGLATPLGSSLQSLPLHQTVVLGREGKEVIVGA